jgi:hypothetical protein
MQATTRGERGPADSDPPVRPCTACGAENVRSATFCWRCLQRFETVPAPTGTGASRPGVAWPQPPPTTASANAHSVRRLVAIVLVLGVLVAVAYVGLRDPEASFPPSFAELERVESAQTELAAEVFRSASAVEGMEADVAFYGSDAGPVAALMWIRGPDAATGTSDEALEAFAAGFASSNNGSVTTSLRVDRTVAGIEYVCAPVTGAVPAGLCMWAEDDVSWVLFDVRPGTDLSGAEDLAVAAQSARP